MRVLVTGANGFVAKTLLIKLAEAGTFKVKPFIRTDSATQLPALVAEADAIIHLAGVNRPQSEDDFHIGNAGLTAALCQAVKSAARKLPLIFASSIQAELDNPYGRSKRDAENLLRELAADTGCEVMIYRLPNVFGKWCKPNYNSVVATFCYNIANDLPIQINDPTRALRLVYVDDVADAFLNALKSPIQQDEHSVQPEYEITLSDLAMQIRAFKTMRTTGVAERVGSGLTRALYSTYMSYLRPEGFFYPLQKNEDPRGEFVEMLKTKDSGQFSYFTAHPGVTRGGHYHHTKTEKFLVVRGTARFRFRHILTDEQFEITTSSDKPQVVETIPGWAHDITNIGNTEMIVMLWANEIFDRQRPDTIASKV
jgi:UDP-2-acetamido-2,6-beta-L-arabino-hexul-4-ose reductase